MTIVATTENNVITTMLTPSEKAELNGCEAIIERGITAYADAARALAAIHRGRLYRATHPTFADYCLERWGWTDRHVRRLMLAADVVDNMVMLVGPMGPIPTSERQARELVDLEPEVAVDVMIAATENGTVRATAARIRAARHARAQDVDVDLLGDIVQAVDCFPEATEEEVDSALATAGYVRRRPLKDDFDRMMGDLEKVVLKASSILGDDRLGSLAHHHPRRGVGRLDTILAELTRLRDVMAGEP